MHSKENDDDSAELQSALSLTKPPPREAMEALLWPDGPVCPHCGSLSKSSAGSRGGPRARPLLLRRLQEPVHRQRSNDLRALQGAAVQVVDRRTYDGVEQEGHERPSASSHAGRFVSDRLVYGSVAFARRCAMATCHRLAVVAERLRLTKKRRFAHRKVPQRKAAPRRAAAASATRSLPLLNAVDCVAEFHADGVRIANLSRSFSKVGARGSPDDR